MMQSKAEYEPHFWMMDTPPYYSRVWLFKTNRLCGLGCFVSRQPRPSGITLRIITAGRWKITMSGKEYQAGYGDVFLALPSTMIEFSHHDPEAEWEWYELQFTGDAANQFVNEFGLSESQPVITPKHMPDALRIFKLLHRLLGNPERDATTIMIWVYRLIQACGKPVAATVEEGQGTARRLVSQAVTLEETDPSSHWNVNEIAERLGVDRTTLGRAFKSVTGKGPHDFLDSYRLMKVEELLRNTAMTVAQTAAAAGFRDEKYFISWFRKKTGQSPGKWRQ